MIPDRTVTIKTHVTSMQFRDDVDLNCLIS